MSWTARNKSNREHRVESDARTKYLERVASAKVVDRPDGIDWIIETPKAELTAEETAALIRKHGSISVNWERAKMVKALLGSHSLSEIAKQTGFGRRQVARDAEALRKFLVQRK